MGNDSYKITLEDTVTYNIHGVEITLYYLGDIRDNTPPTQHQLIEV